MQIAQDELAGDRALQIQSAHQLLKPRGALLSGQHGAGRPHRLLVPQEFGVDAVELAVGRLQLLKMAADVPLVAEQDDGVLAHGEDQRRKEQQEDHLSGNRFQQLLLELTHTFVRQFKHPRLLYHMFEKIPPVLSNSHNHICPRRHLIRELLAEPVPYKAS